MKNKITFWIISAFVLMGVGVFFFYKTPAFFHHHETQAAQLYTCAMHPSFISDHPGNCPICGMKLIPLVKEKQNSSSQNSREFTVDQLMKMKSGEICLLHKCKMGNCQMVLTEAMARTGKCPHCGEDLGVIIKEALPEGYATVHLDPEKQKAIDVETAVVGEQSISKTIYTTGRIAYDPELYEAQKDYLMLRRQLAREMQFNVAPIVKQKMTQEFNLARQRLQLLGMTDNSIRKLEIADFADSELVLPKSKGPVWLYVTIYDFEKPYVREGSKIKVKSTFYPNETFHGVVRAIDEVPDMVNRAAILPRVRALIENPKGLLKLNMPVDVQFEDALGNVLLIPQEAVFQMDDNSIVFVKKDNQTFEPRRVVVGEQSKGNLEVLSGLSKGEQVVISGNFLIDSESRLKASLEGAVSGGGHHHGN